MGGIKKLSILLLVAMALPAGAQTPAANAYVFPIFVDGVANGSSYKAVVRIVQSGAASAMRCTLTQRNTSAPFTGVDGDFYTADVLDSGFSPPAVSQISLDPFLPFEILRTAAQSPLKVGYATLSCPGPVQAEVQIALSDAQGKKISEATVPPATAGSSFQFLLDRRDGTRLGFSFANDSGATEQYAVIARDQFNYEVDRVYEFIDPWSQVSRFVDEELTLPSNFVGSIEIAPVNGSRNFVVGLQFTGSVFTTVQPLVR
jgi:hypothetical protein